MVIANQRNVVNKGAEFLDLLNHPLFDELLAWFLGDYSYLSQASVNILGPNNVPMPFHRDQVPINPFTDDPVGLSFMFYMEDSSKMNGATHVIPASHIGHVRPRNPNSFVSLPQNLSLSETATRMPSSSTTTNTWPCKGWINPSICPGRHLPSL